VSKARTPPDLWPAACQRTGGGLRLPSEPVARGSHAAGVGKDAGR
jgi:hypothetical protein